MSDAGARRRAPAARYLHIQRPPLPPRTPHGPLIGQRRGGATPGSRGIAIMRPVALIRRFMGGTADLSVQHCELMPQHKNLNREVPPGGTDTDRSMEPADGYHQPRAAIAIAGPDPGNPFALRRGREPARSRT
jgi:hypothetical protein